MAFPDIGIGFAMSFQADIFHVPEHIFVSNSQRSNTLGLRIFATSNKRRDSICNQKQIKKLDYQNHDCGAIELLIFRSSIVCISMRLYQN